MDDAQSARQIQQMVSFILNEAKDKAEEIDAKTLEEFNIEKLKFCQDAKDKIRAEYNAKKKKAETQVAIERSTNINKARLRKIEARQNSMVELKDWCTKDISKAISDKNKYTNLIGDLIVQGCLKLVEDQVVVKCRKEDEGVVKAALDGAARKYADLIKRETKAEKRVALSIGNTYLPSQCLGGVVLSCQEGSISIDNTLATRLTLLMDNDLPALRAMIFPARR